MKIYFRKEKNYVGKLISEQWIRGGICYKTEELFLIKVSDRKTGTLLTAIKNSIQEGTTIYSDCWCAYNSELLKSSSFNHFTINRTFNFVNLTTGVYI